MLSELAPAMDRARQASMAFGFIAVAFVASVSPCLAGDVTISMKQAREYVSAYMGLTVFYTAVAAECDHVPAGTFAGRYGLMEWQGDRDDSDMIAKAQTYRVLRLEMIKKLVSLSPNEQVGIDASVARKGGEDVGITTIRASLREGLADYQQRGFGKTDFCATNKTTVMNAAAGIGQPPEPFRVVP